MKASEQRQASSQGADVIKVLIADDDPPTRILLRAAISQWGYEVLEASNGEEAWELLKEKNAPRLLILDWLMPKLDGITLCERIKTEKPLPPYIILLTQVTGTTNIIKGLEAGADEFLSKPFNMAELRSRLSVGARIIRFENTLAEQNKKMQAYASDMDALSQAHAKQLVFHSDLLSMLGSLIENLAIEVQLSTSALYEKKDSAALANIKLAAEQLEKVIAVIKRLQHNSIASPKTAALALNDLIKTALDLCRSRLKNIEIELELSPQLPLFSADPDQLQEMFLGLILSTADLIQNNERAYLRITTHTQVRNTIQIIMDDSGPRIPETELQVLQQPHFISKDLEAVRTRLSAAMCKEIIYKYGGKLSIENRPEGGVRLKMDLPLAMRSEERA